MRQKKLILFLIIFAMTFQTLFIVFFQQKAKRMKIQYKP